MENKKTLIIIPPMSQALQKLNEVLGGIAGEENIDISIIDDLKELGQVLASSGQCLILCSNPKKCATFLQENRFVISRFHSKTILLTPQEIPVKTLVKFTKVGLTESILENSAPKTLLYKIKLQLRSIKTTSKEDKDKEVVKSMMDINADLNAANEEEKIHHETAHNQEVALDEDHKPAQKAGEELVLTQAEVQRKKKSTTEDVIDTHWKTKRKNTDAALDLYDETDNEDIKKNDDIDLYYRGDLKKNAFSLEESDLYTKNKNEVVYESAEKAERKKSSYQDVITEELMRHDSNYVAERTDAPMQVKPGEGDISIEMEKSKKTTEQESDYSNDESTRPQLNTEIDLSPARKNKKIADDITEDAPQEQITTIDLDENNSKRKQAIVENEYDDRETDRKRKETEIELTKEKEKTQQAEELEAEKNNKKKSIELSLEEDIAGDFQTEHIDTYLRKGKSSLDQNNKIDIDDDKEENESKANKYEHDENDKKSKLTELDLDSERKKREENSYENSENNTNNQRLSELIDLDDEDNKNNDKSTNEAVSNDERQNVVRNNETKLDLIDENERNKIDIESREVNLKKLSNSQLEIEKSRNSNSEGFTEKIDTFYRNPGAQKPEHSWDFEQNKSPTELSLTHNRKADVNLGANFQHKDNGEITIDYRKLKEEFDSIARGEIAGNSDAIAKSSRAGVDPEDEGTFKVIELNTKGIDLSVSILNMIYQKNIRPKQIYSLIAEEILTKYGGMTVFWDYKSSSKKHDEVYNSYLELVHAEITSEKKDWWLEYKKDKELFDHFQSRTMSNWRCPQIMDKNAPWEDVELPSWAKNELADKTVELAFPYFDGVDRMGLGLVIFHNGLRPEHEHSILTSLEMARHLLLDTIQRSSVNHSSYTTEKDDGPENKEESNKKVLNFFGGLFGKKKAG